MADDDRSRAARARLSARDGRSARLSARQPERRAAPPPRLSRRAQRARGARGPVPRRAPRSTCRRRSKTSTRSTSRSACATSTSRSTSRIRPAIRSSSRSARRRPRSLQRASASRDAGAARRSRCWSALGGRGADPAAVRPVPPARRPTRTLAWWAMAVAVCSPLFWFTALRPLSDMTGLAFAVAAQVAARAGAGLDDADRRGRRHRGAGSSLGRWLSRRASAACGVRVADGDADGAAARSRCSSGRGPGCRSAHRLLALVAAVAGVLVWAVPLLVASGGLGGYLDGARHAGRRGLLRRRDAVDDRQARVAALTRC